MKDVRIATRPASHTVEEERCPPGKVHSILCISNAGVEFSETNIRDRTPPKGKSILPLECECLIEKFRRIFEPALQHTPNAADGIWER